MVGGGRDLWFAARTAHLCDYDPPDGVGDAGVDSDEVKLEGRGAERVELNAELRPEVVKIPAVDLAWVVTWEIGRRDLCAHKSVALSRVSSFLMGSSEGAGSSPYPFYSLFADPDEVAVVSGSSH